MTPREHFFALREMLPELNGLAILDSDRSQRTDTDKGGLQVRYWRRYEVENYFITPAVLKQYVKHGYSDLPLFVELFASESDEVLDALILERVFSGRASDFATWQGLDVDAARLLWEARTERIKLSDFAEAFFRRVAERLGHAMLLRKGDLHQLVNFVDPQSIPAGSLGDPRLAQGALRRSETGRRSMRNQLHQRTRLVDLRTHRGDAARRNTWFEHAKRYRSQ